MDQDQPTNDEIIKMDLENKQSSQDFKITTMEDDLKRVAGLPGNHEEDLTVRIELPSAKEPIPVSSPSAAVPYTPTPIKTSTPPPLSPPIAPVSSVPTPPSSRLPNIPEFLLEDETSNRGKMKSFMLGFAVVLALGLLGFGGWWYYAGRAGVTQPSPTPTPTPAPPSPIQKPSTPSDTPLISVNKSVKLEVDANETAKGFLSKLSSRINETQKDSSSRDIVRVIPATQQKLLTLNELSAIMGIEIPSSVSREAFTLIAYVQKSESSPVWGLILKTTSDEAKAEMTEKESRLPGIVQNLYADYTNSSLPKGQSEVFLDNNFEGVAIRYINFDIPGRALDYAFIHNLLLFAGSRDSMYALIERANVKESVQDTTTIAPSS